MKRIIGTVAALSLVFGLGAFTANNLASAPQAPTEMRQNTQFCQTCYYVWNPRTQSYIRHCYLVVCQAV